MAKKKALKDVVEEGIASLLESKDEPSEGRMKALALGIKMCALNAKLEESEYGDFFTADEPRSTGGLSPGAGEKSPGRKRANGSGTGELDD